MFVLLTYLATGSVEIPLTLNKHGYAAIHISKGIQAICTLSPGIVGFVLVAIFFGKNGLRTLLKTVVKWRIKVKWYVIVAVLGIALVGFSLLSFDVIYGRVITPDAFYNYFFYFILILPLSALWEEIGWRGFLLPILQEKNSALKASLIIGLVWGIWHLPIYMAIDPYGDRTIIYFLIMFVGCFAISIIQTWMYNATSGSLFICILLHNSINTSAAYFYGNLTGHEFRPLIFLTVSLVLIAIWICLRTKGTLTEIGKPIVMMFRSQRPEVNGSEHPVNQSTNSIALKA